jgi:dolichol-phosphate mannosyltransferase
MVGGVANTVVILPTYNESESLKTLIPKLRQHGVDVLVVDDSPDDATASVAERLGASVIHRNKRGRMSALLDGISATTHKYVITMDADGQHPPEAIPAILEALKRHDVAIASRRVDGGGYEDFTWRRKLVSNVANLLAWPLTPGVKDRTSGFVAFRREVLDGARMPEGFSTFTLGLLVSGKYAHVTEVPYVFKQRTAGESKLRLKYVLNHLAQLGELYLAKFRILRFALVGASGVVVGLGSLYALTEFAGLHYLASYVLSFLLSVTNNYVLNSKWTFTQSIGALKWTKYAVVCAGTLALNTALMYVLTDIADLWYMASAILVVLIVFLLNYALSKRIVWPNA